MRHDYDINDHIKVPRELLEDILKMLFNAQSMPWVMAHGQTLLWVLNQNTLPERAFKFESSIKITEVE